MQEYDLLNDYEKDVLGIDDFKKCLSNNNIVKLKGLKRSICVGQGLSLKVNTSVGLSNIYFMNEELDKINSIISHKYHPDIMMDLSTVAAPKPIYKSIIEEIGCPVGTIPYYLCFDKRKGIDRVKLLEIIEQQAQEGISFMTLHLTADLKLAEIAKSRKIPVISRGGSLLLRDMKINNRTENIVLELLDEIINICRKHSIVISLGTTFRPSTLYDAIDEVNVEEISRQNELAMWLKSQNIAVMMEGIGHIPINRIPEYVSLIRKKQYIPFMPLGPIVSDHTQGEDHITSAVGACTIASLNGADIINSITREEHTGGVPSIESILEGLDTAKTVVQIINDARFPRYFQEQTKECFNCMGKSGVLGCERCNIECPFIWNKDAESI